MDAPPLTIAFFRGLSIAGFRRISTAMRFAILPLMLLCGALAVRANAQEIPPAVPDGKGKPGEPATAASPGRNERKEVASEFSTAGSVRQSPALPSRYLFLIGEAMRRFQVRDFKGATDYIDRADEMLPPTARSLNVRGAMAIDQHDFERGQKYCMDALAVDPGYFPAKFNICEIPFLQGKYAEARGLWLTLFDSAKWGDATLELLTYRIFLTYLLDKDFEHANEWMEKIPFPSRTPAYQYARAAWARQHGDTKKWNEWIRSASFVWPEMKRNEFMNVLVQLGWLKWE